MTRRLPFDIISSSVTTGYIAEVGQQFITGADFSNFHGDGEQTLQGPFTERYVGGQKYRHNEPFATSSVRMEGWELRFANNKKLYITKPSGSLPLYREPRAKSVLNAKHIRGGNYWKDYELTQINNSKKAFVISGGFSTVAVSSPYISGVVDYTKPDYGAFEYVFTEQFSAPGDVASQFVDLPEGKYSPYNSLVYRNILLRRNLNDWYTEACQFGGARENHSVSPITFQCSASYHKTQRNGAEVLKFSGSSTSSYVTASVYDNWFVQHAIPQSDFQYAWAMAASTSSA